MSIKISCISLAVLIQCTSCASIFGTRTEALRIVTSQPSTVVVNNIPLQTNQNHLDTKVTRSSEPLELIVSSDSLTKNVSIEPKSNFLFWSNLGFAYGIGMIVDWKNPKRFTYPSTVYIDMSNKENEYAKVDVSKMSVKNIIKFTPLKLIGTSNPGIQLAYERKHNDYISTQIMVQSLFKQSPLITYYGVNPNRRGFRASIEERYYHDKTSPVGGYIGLELNYMNMNERDIFSFTPIEPTFDNDSLALSLAYNDSLLIDKTTFSITFKVGKQWIKNNFVIDFYSGFGLRHKNVIYQNRINKEHFRTYNADFFPDTRFISNIEGSYWTVVVPLNIKIGYTF